jgi:hypothetical protein
MVKKAGTEAEQGGVFESCSERKRPTPHGDGLLVGKRGYLTCTADGRCTISFDGATKEEPERRRRP